MVDDKVYAVYDTYTQLNPPNVPKSELAHLINVSQGLEKETISTGKEEH